MCDRVDRTRTRADQYAQSVEDALIGRQRGHQHQSDPEAERHGNGGDPTVSRLISTLAADAPAALSAINTARAAARAQAWTAAGTAAPNHDRDVRHPLIIDLDATLVTAHSDKEHATPNWKKGFGFHPLCAFADHQAAGTGEPLAIMLRPGNAGSNTAADHIS
ncbi:hypothetical protein GOPIP_094_01100, partial [Gordonia polyisoprenivorans NBRC 16320 = JCM 10675]